MKPATVVERMTDSGLVDWNDAERNLYGCTPCPDCGENYRYATGRGESAEVVCDECGRREPATFAEDGG